MKTGSILSIAICVTLLFAVSAGAQQSLVETVANGCKAEIDTYCKDVTPGEGRVLACLYAHGDKLSGKCEYALYDAAAQLERAVAALSYVVNECTDDLDQFCMGVAAGNGRLKDCLEKNDSKVSSRCKDAMKQVGLK
ncbi:cysteine rich repeat-containing protein [Desulfosarcina sp.]|uniref:cysteine rich repeat-containing protein n=1 Tax=Desulfosarcina sp. TaxID=2027861 RepID=UPI003970A12A